MSQFFNVSGDISQSSLRRTGSSRAEAQSGLRRPPNLGGMSLHRRLQTQTGEESAPFRQLRLQLLLDCQRMVGNSARVVVLELSLEFEYATAQLEVLRENAGTIILKLTDPERSHVV